MDKKLRYIYTMEYYSAIKRNKYESVELREMSLEPIIQSEVSQKNKSSYINTYIWNLEKWYWWTYLEGKNRDTDIENRLVDTKGEGGDELGDWVWHIYYV